MVSKRTCNAADEKRESKAEAWRPLATCACAFAHLRVYVAVRARKNPIMDFNIV